MELLRLISKPLIYICFLCLFHCDRVPPELVPGQIPIDSYEVDNLTPKDIEELEIQALECAYSTERLMIYYSYVQPDEKKLKSWEKVMERHYSQP